MVSDVLRGRALEASWLFQVAWAPEGLRSEIGLHLSRGPDGRNVVVLSRGEGPAFDERDRLVLQLLRPHVQAAVRRAALPTVSLTEREREVLVLVAEGMTNGQVARRLGIAEATVAKHLEHVLARTGLRSRVQLVASIEALLAP
jgi:DNA-binding CsgD family transcriptional regulator